MYTRQQKVTVGVLIFFACITLILGFAQIQKTLRASLLFDDVTSNKNVAAASQSDSLFQVDFTKDTDGDGLLDQDELTRYGTSPYLSDSDSDGKDDRAEIEAGEDPNCPKGRQCALGATNTKDQGSSTRTLTDLLSLQSNMIANGDVSPSVGAPSPQELRRALRASGVSDAQLDALDDATLLRLYGETEADVQVEQAKRTSDAGGNDAAPAKLSGAQIRGLLKAQGMSDAELAKYDDAALEQLFLESLKEQVQSAPSKP